MAADERAVSLKADLRGRCALITGASNGLGVHIANVLAAPGCTVSLAARRTAALETPAANINASGGCDFAIHLDVRNARSVQNGVAVAVSEGGAMDILVNNSGVTLSATALDQNEEHWDCVLDTNLKGAYLAAAAVARTTRDPGRDGSFSLSESWRLSGHVTWYA